MFCYFEILSTMVFNSKYKIEIVLHLLSKSKKAMKEICLPIPHLASGETAEVTITIGNKKSVFNFRIEQFEWQAENEVTNSLTRINRLKKAIADYDTSWELLQIFSADENATHVQVLYRKKN